MASIVNTESLTQSGVALETRERKGVLNEPRRGGRLKELDALRGLAACTVVFCHFYNLHEAGKQPFLIQLLFRGLFRFLVAGHESVLLFFVLSGFVLTLPFLRPRKPYYFPFLVKRVCRIYLPYLGAVVFAVFGDLLFHNKIPSLSPWFQAIWSQPVTWSLVLKHAGLIGNFDQMQLNGAFWSLVIEMRVSIIFPLLMLLLRGIRTQKAVLITGVAVVLLGLLPLESDNLIPSPYGSTLHYAMVFIVGSLLARSSNVWSRMYRDRSRFFRATLAVCALGAWSFTGLIAGHPSLVGLYDMILTVAAACVIITALNESLVRVVLLHRVSQYLGEISYSVYLLHVTVLLSLVHALYGRLPLYALLPIYLVLTLVLSSIFHAFVEAPSTRLGVWISKIMEYEKSVSGERSPANSSESVAVS
jgi:peptidoglycan/LPS O-acetylase OafA/YrhL